MAFLFLLFTVALSLCVVGLVVIALAAILGRLRDDWKLKKIERQPRPGDY
jgi:VIT1/CCC1 family predicted Fe2+/Mn2+ transporter